MKGNFSFLSCTVIITFFGFTASVLFAGEEKAKRVKEGAVVQSAMTGAGAAVTGGSAATSVGTAISLTAAAGAFTAVKGIGAIGFWGAYCLTSIFDPPFSHESCVSEFPDSTPLISATIILETGATFDSVSPGTPIKLTGSNFGIGPELNKVKFDTQLVFAIGISDSELITVVPYPTVDSFPQQLSAVVVVADTVDTLVSSSFPIIVTAPDSAPGLPGSLINRLVDLETSFHQNLLSWGCSRIAETKFVPEGQAEFLSVCDYLVNFIAPNMLDTLAVFSQKLQGLGPDTLRVFDEIVAPSQFLLDSLEFDLIPAFSDPDGDSIPTLWDDCPEHYNPLQENIKAGDANGSGGTPNLTDIIFLVNYVFKGGPAPSPLCRGDANGSGGTSNLTDIIYLLNYVFKGGPAPLKIGVCCL